MYCYFLDFKDRKISKGFQENLWIGVEQSWCTSSNMRQTKGKSTTKYTKQAIIVCTANFKHKNSHLLQQEMRCIIHTYQFLPFHFPLFFNWKIFFYYPENIFYHIIKKICLKKSGFEKSVKVGIYVHYFL